MEKIKPPETIELRPGEPREIPERTIFVATDGGIWVRDDGEWVELRTYLRRQACGDRMVCKNCGMDLWILEGQYAQCHSCKQWYQFYAPYTPEPIKGEPSELGWEGDTTI